MAIEWHHVIPYVLDELKVTCPRSILDVGVNIGAYGAILRDKLRFSISNTNSFKLDGLELGTFATSSLHSVVYERVYHARATEPLDHIPTYDVVLVGDTLSRLDKETGKQLLQRLLAKTNRALIGVAPAYVDQMRDLVSEGDAQPLSRWWELDFVEFDAATSWIPLKNNGFLLFKAYPSTTKRHYGPMRGVAAPKWRPLHVAYFVPHKNLTGGVKTLLQQMKYLRERGHKVTAIYKGTEKDNRAIPPWTDVVLDGEIVIRNSAELKALRSKFDVVVAGWCQQLPELVDSKLPVFYWEKGHEGLFGDFSPQVKADEIRRVLHYCYSMPSEIASVSTIVSKLLESRYGRSTQVIPDGVELADFPVQIRKTSALKTILLVGNPALRFKGFNVALRVLTRVWEAGYRFHVRWICQIPPMVTGIPFPIDYVVSPPQAELPSHYRQADIFLFTSWYEGFGMPPLEAMAYGVPTVLTDCGGISEYVEPGVNALVADPGDVDSLAAAIIFLLEDEDARAYLIQQGRRTAERFDIKKVVQMIEERLLVTAESR